MCCLAQIRPIDFIVLCFILSHYFSVIGKILYVQLWIANSLWMVSLGLHKVMVQWYLQLQIGPHMFMDVIHRNV